MVAQPPYSNSLKVTVLDISFSHLHQKLTNSSSVLQRWFSSERREVVNVRQCLILYRVCLLRMSFTQFHYKYCGKFWCPFRDREATCSLLPKGRQEDCTTYSLEDKIKEYRQNNEEMWTYNKLHIWCSYTTWDKAGLYLLSINERGVCTLQQSERASIHNHWEKIVTASCTVDCKNVWYR